MKRGIVQVSGILYREQWDMVRLIFLDFRPVHIEYDNYYDKWLFVGDSMQFEECKEGHAFPTYMATLNTSSGSVVFEKIKP